MKLKLFIGSLILSCQMYASGVIAYVTNSGDDTISVIDTATNTVIDTISVDFFPTGIAASPGGDIVYAPMFSDDSIYAIDTSTNTIQNTISMPKSSKPTAVAVAPSGLSYYTNFTNGTIATIEPTSMTVIDFLPIGSLFPASIVVLPSGTKAYVVNGVGPMNVKVIDLSTNSVTATVNTSAQSLGIGVSPDSSKVYVANTMASTVSVINTTTDTVSANIIFAASSFPRDIAVLPSGTYAYVVLQGSSSVAVVDTTLNLVTATIPLTSRSDPYNIAITPDGLYAYVTQTLTNTVSVINTTTNTVVTTIPVGAFPVDVAITTVP